MNNKPKHLLKVIIVGVYRVLNCVLHFVQQMVFEYCLYLLLLHIQLKETIIIG